MWRFGEPLFFFASGMALGISVHPFCLTIRWIVMNFCTDIHVPQMMKPTDFGDPLTFYLVPP